MRVCLECADGGHLDEMLALEDSFKGLDIFFVTFDTEMTRRLRTLQRVRFVPNFSGVIDTPRLPLLLRELYTTTYLLRTTLRCFRILHLENPDVIVSTGGPVTIPLFIIGKLLGIPTIYIESLTRIYDLSGTGKIVYHWADLFLVQWPALSKRYVRTEYWGRLL